MDNKNKLPFSHRGHNGTVISSTCELRPVVKYDRPNNISEQQFVSDIAEIFAYHAMMIWPDLQPFNGYDCLQFEPASLTYGKEDFYKAWPLPK